MGKTGWGGGGGKVVASLMPRENTGLLYSRSRSQLELISVTVCEDDIFWTDELLAMMSGDASSSVLSSMRKRLLCHLQGQGQSEGSFF